MLFQKSFNDEYNQPEFICTDNFFKKVGADVSYENLLYAPGEYKRFKFYYWQDNYNRIIKYHASPIYGDDLESDYNSELKFRNIGVNVHPVITYTFTDKVLQELSHLEVVVFEDLINPSKYSNHPINSVSIKYINKKLVPGRKYILSPASRVYWSEATYFNGWSNNNSFICDDYNVYVRFYAQEFNYGSGIYETEQYKKSYSEALNIIPSSNEIYIYGYSFSKGFTLYKYSLLCKDCISNNFKDIYDVFGGV